jgi:type I restriction enzyme S subunit
MIDIVEQQDIEQMLPEGWRWVRLGDHALKIGSGVTPRGGHEAYVSSGIPLIRSQNVHHHKFVRKGLAFITPEQDEDMQGSRVQPQDILLNITGASIGRVCIVPDDICPANVNQHVSIIRLDGTIDPIFLALYISNPEFQKHILNLEAGATRQALTKLLIENFRIPLPRLSEQKRISRILNEQLEEIQQARAAAEAQFTAAQKLQAAYLRCIFEGESTKGWRSATVGDILLDIQTGKSLQCEERPAGPEEWGILKVSAVSWNEFRQEENKVLPNSIVPLPQHEVSSGDIIISRANTTELVGAAVLVEHTRPRLLLSDKTLRLVPDTDVVIPKFLLASLKTRVARAFIEENATGTSDSMKNISQQTIRSIPIRIPYIGIQRQLIDTYDQQMSAVKAIMTILHLQLGHIKTIPAALLRQAFSGAL